MVEKYLEVLKSGKPYFSEDLIPDPGLGEIRVPVKAFKVGDALGIVMLLPSQGTTYYESRVIKEPEEARYGAQVLSPQQETIPAL